MLGAVILVDPANVAPQRHSPDEEQEERDSDDAVHQVENDLLSEYGVHPLQFRRCQQRQKLVHEDEETDRDDDVDRSHPAADFQFLLVFVFVRLGLQFVEGDVGGKTQRAETERHRMTQGDDAANDRPRHPFVLFRQPLQRFAVSGHFARRFATGDGPCVRRAHHNAFEHGLAADQRFFAAFEGGQ